MLPSDPDERRDWKFVFIYLSIAIVGMGVYLGFSWLTG